MTMKAILLCTAVLFTVPVQAEQAEEIQAPYSATITMRSGYVGAYQTTGPVKDVMIGRPDVVDVIPQSDRVLMLTAKAPGTTNLLLLDADGKQVANLGIQVIGRDVNRVQIHTMLGNLHGYWAYECGPEHCNRVDDRLAGSDRVPVYPPIIVGPGAAPPVNSPR
jgi:Pilus formation protein N terminal region